MKNFSYSSVLCVLLLSMSFGAFSAEGLNVDLAILKINKEAKSLNKEILTLKDEIEILRENQRLNSEKIDELLQMIELNQTNNKTSEKSIETNPQPSELFRDGNSSFVLGNYDKAIQLFLSHLNNSPNDKSLTDTQLWLSLIHISEPTRPY